MSKLGKLYADKKALWQQRQAIATKIDKHKMEISILEEKQKELLKQDIKIGDQMIILQGGKIYE
jgi:hypothetical protein